MLQIAQNRITYAIQRTSFLICPLLYHFGKFFGFVCISQCSPTFLLILWCFLWMQLLLRKQEWQKDVEMAMMENLGSVVVLPEQHFSLWWNNAEPQQCF